MNLHSRLFHDIMSYLRTMILVVCVVILAMSTIRTLRCPVCTSDFFDMMIIYSALVLAEHCLAGSCPSSEVVFSRFSHFLGRDP